jgi:ferritin-like metal-binding protein YciE
LEEVFELLGKTAKAKTCKAMQGLIKEATELMEKDADDAVMAAPGENGFAQSPLLP